jgi:gluconokinase
MIRVSRAAAVDPLVLAVDVGSTATRGDVYDAAGRPVQGGRCKMPHQFVTAADGTSQIDPDAVVEEVAQVIGQLAGRWRARRIAAVALDTFASSLVGVRPDGSAATPCYTYADSRCVEQVIMLRGELDEPAIQQRTGCRLHTSYLAPRLRWLQATQPGAFAAAARWMSVGEYVYLRLLGTTAAGTSIAAWTGLLDRRTGRWDDELVATAGLRAGQLSDIRDPTEPFDDAGSVIGSRWPALASSVWLPVVADGIAGNIGAGATDEQTQALAAATSGAIRVLLHHIPAAVPSGLWCYRVDRDRSLLGGAVNDVGRAVSWLSQTLRLPDHLDLDLSAAPDPAAPLVLPYLSGERSIGWAASTRATFSGVGSHNRGDAGAGRHGRRGHQLCPDRRPAIQRSRATEPCPGQRKDHQGPARPAAASCRRSRHAGHPRDRQEDDPARHRDHGSRRSRTRRPQGSTVGRPGPPASRRRLRLLRSADAGLRGSLRRGHRSGGQHRVAGTPASALACGPSS